MERATVEQWVDRYEQLWRTAGTAELDDLFTSTATYLPSPWADPVEGLEQIAEFWEAEREGADERFTMSSEVLAVDGDVAVVRVFVDYLDGGRERWRDLWVMRLDADGRCSSFEEWPFAPEQPDGH